MNKTAIVISCIVLSVIFIFSETEYSKSFRSYVGNHIPSATSTRCSVDSARVATSVCPQHNMFGSLIKDNEHLYYDGVVLVTPSDLDIESFTLLPGGSYGTDTNSVYDVSDVYRYGSSVVPEKIRSADPQTFRVLYDGGVRYGVRTSAYGADAQHVYIGQQMLPNADPDTFEFLTEFGIGCENNRNDCPIRVTTKDKNCIYLDGEKVLDDTGSCVDPRTCIHNPLCAVRTSTVILEAVVL
jgi:hypothetical protein